MNNPSQRGNAKKKKKKRARNDVIGKWEEKNCYCIRHCFLCSCHKVFRHGSSLQGQLPDRVSSQAQMEWDFFNAAPSDAIFYVAISSIEGVTQVMWLPCLISSDSKRQSVWRMRDRNIKRKKMAKFFIIVFKCVLHQYMSYDCQCCWPDRKSVV